MLSFNHFKTVFCFVLLLGTLLISSTDLYSQSTYLKGIGETEDQLLNHLDRSHAPPLVRRATANMWVIEKEGLNATYIFNSGKVSSILLNQSFVSVDLAKEALEDSSEFLRDRGVFLEPIKQDAHTAILRGTGNGLNANLFLTTEPGGTYRFNAGVSCRGE